MYKVYSILDKVAEEFSPPFLAHNDGVANRHYQAFLSKNPPETRGEFALHCLADWDHKLGIIAPRAYPEEVEVQNTALSRGADVTEIDQRR